MIGSSTDEDFKEGSEMEQPGWIHRVTSSVRNMKFQRKLMLGYLLVGIIPLLIVSASIYYRSAAALEDSAQEFASLYTSQIKTSLNQFVQEYDKVTKLVLVDSDLVNIENPSPSMDERILRKITIQKLLMRVAVLKPEIANLILIDRDDNFYQYSNSTNTVNENALLAQEWYKELRSSEETFFVTGLHDRSYYEDHIDGVVVTVGRVLFSSNGAYAGMLLIELDPFMLLQLNHDFVMARDKYGISVLLYNRHGDIIYHSDAASGRVNWKHILEVGGHVGKEQGDGERIVLSGNTESGELSIKTEIPHDKLLLKISRVKAVTIMVIVMCCLVMLVLTLGISYTITKPITALRRSMKQAEVGQYLPIDKEQANDEIGSLVRSYNKMIVTIRSLIEDVYIAEIKHRKAKYVALQNQINPHMLYNTLESIRMKALVKEEEEIAEMIKILARMFRLSLGKEGRYHSVKHEVEYTTNYLKILNIRFGNKFRLDIRIPEEMMQCSIIPLVFQPIVENSVKHGYHDYSRTMSIEIEGQWTDEGEITFRITDDGTGMLTDKQEELRVLLGNADSDKYKMDETDDLADKGLGLKNIAERIKLHYGDSYGLTIQSEFGTGTSVKVCIPRH
jgi:two-component system, sensor histidine kinase YesM